jgi:hypothetical protein
MRNNAEILLQSCREIGQAVNLDKIELSTQDGKIIRNLAKIKIYVISYLTLF